MMLCGRGHLRLGCVVIILLSYAPLYHQFVVIKIVSLIRVSNVMHIFQKNFKGKEFIGWNKYSLVIHFLIQLIQ